ncbi:putative RNA-dependent RNA-polymerase [Bactrocera dorsalis negev-like virus]|nr:putative RNA-dependent RNA-polymerase [Bactrocera dorsalis negev-like virus]
METEKQPYSPEQVSEFLNIGTGLTQPVLLSLLNSNDSNPLRDTLINRINNELHFRLNSKGFIGKITISECLSTEESIRLQSTFSELDISFTNDANNTHGFAAASRKCERVILLNRLQIDTQKNSGKILVKDVGGDIVRSVALGEKNVHCCSPLLTSYDATRYSNRLYNAGKLLEKGLFKDHYSKDVLTWFSQSYASYSGNTYFCFNKSENCSVKAGGLLFLHSVYDMTLRDIGNAMDRADALVAYGSFIYSSKILTDDNGTIEWINSHYKITRSKITNARKKIIFGFKDDSGFSYEHDYQTYMSLLTKSQFSSDNKNYYSIELLENRNGIQFFRVNKLPFYYNKPTSHRLYLTHLNNKYMVRFPYFSYKSTDKTYSFPMKGNRLTRGIKAKDDFWYNLPNNVNWIYMTVDADVVDKTCAYVLGATEEKFRPEHIITYIRSITTRETMYTTVSKKSDLPPLDTLSALSHAIYITLYQTKYVYGKALQQAKLNVNALRNNSKPEYVLAEFDGKNNYFARFVRFILNRKSFRFDPRKFIMTPSEYIEFRTSIIGDTCIVNNNFHFGLEISDILITEELMSEQFGVQSLNKAKPTQQFSNIAPTLSMKQKFLKLIRAGKSNKPTFTKNVFPELSVKKTISAPIVQQQIPRRRKKRQAPLPPIVVIPPTPVQSETEPGSSTTASFHSISLESVKHVGSDSPTTVSAESDSAQSSQQEPIYATIVQKVTPDLIANAQNESVVYASLDFDKNPSKVPVENVVEENPPVKPPRKKKSIDQTETEVIYPRMGIFNEVKREVDVDGSRNECCFLAMTEDRAVDVRKLRDLIFSNSKPEPSTDLYVELQPGSLAGTAVLTAFAKIYNLKVTIDSDEYGKIIINPHKNSLNVVRTINLALRNNHYYYLPSCKKQFPLNYRRDVMFEPMSWVATATSINQVIDVVESSYQALSNVKHPGCYLVNNLVRYCNLHSECRNNDLLRYVELLYNLRSTNISICMVFEKENFDVEYLTEIRNSYPDLGFRYVDVKLNGYFVAVIHKLPNVKDIDAMLTHKSFMDHTCDEGSFVVVDSVHDIVYRCKNNEGNVLHVNHDFADMYIEIKQKPLNENTDTNLIHKTPNRLVLYGSGKTAGHIENMNEICKVVTSHLKSHSPTRSLSVVLNSEFTEVNPIIDIIKLRYRFVFVKSEVYRSFHTDLSIEYLPDISGLDYRKNAMYECYQIWFFERTAVENQLMSAYTSFLNAVTHGVALLSNIDSTVCLLDLHTGKFIRGHNPNPPYHWGYSSIGLFNTTTLFNNKGDLIMNNVPRLTKLGVRYVVFNSASKLMHGITMTTTYGKEMVKTLKDIPITYVQGVPGAGKTQYILDSNVGKTDNMILTVTREAREDIVKRATTMGLVISEERIRTLDSVLINNKIPSQVKEVWLDEAFLVHPGQWCWLYHLTNCERLIVVGDDAQIPYINRSGLPISRQKTNGWVMKNEVLSINHRNPLDIVAWLDVSRFYNFKVTGTSTIEKSVNRVLIHGVSDLPTDSAAKYLTFTQSEKSTIMTETGFDVNTIHEYQGSQNDVIYLVRLVSKESNPIYNSLPHILVSLTRHRKKFVYFTTRDKDHTCKQISKIQSFSKLDFDKVRQPKLLGGSERVMKPDSSTVLYTENKEAREVLLNSFGTGYISASYFKTTSFVPPEVPIVPNVLNFDYRMLQDFVDRVFPGSSTEFREFDHEMFEYYYNRCNFSDVSISLSLPVFKKYDRLQSNLRTSIQYPLHQSQKLSLKAFFERNGQVPQLQGFIDAGAEAQRLLRDFKKLCPHSRNFKDDQIFQNINNTQEWLRTQPPGVISMIKADELFFDLNFTVYDFIIKTIPKIDLEIGAEFRYKAPQTIAFQKKGINAVFCPILKEMMSRVEYSLNENIVLYNRMSPQEFSQQFSKVLPPRRYQELDKFLEIDFSKYDKSQGLVILMFEALLMEWLGVPPLYIRIWIVMHRTTYIIDRNNKFSAEVEYQRKSGDAGTWRLNTIVQMAVLNRVYKLYDLFNNDLAVACFSGDDSLIFLKNQIPYLEEKTFKLECVYNLEAKILNYSVPYFCSKFLLLVDNEWIFVPDTMKLIIKLGRNDLTDYEHVECYRVSFDDNLYYYKFSYYWSYISCAINDRYNLVGEHDCVYMTLLHLVSSKENFSKLYSEQLGHIKGNFSIRPLLEI